VAKQFVTSIFLRFASTLGELICAYEIFSEESMLLISRNNRQSIVLLGSILLFLIVNVTAVKAQRSGPSMRDQARSIQKADMDRLLVSAQPASSNANAAHPELVKQVRADFKELQELNNKMMATAWEQQAVDYSVLSDMLSRMKGKANRLKTNLHLPATGELNKATAAGSLPGAKEFCGALLILDQTILRFVKNPLFQTRNTLDVDQAARARQDLEDIISLTTDLKKTASTLSKLSPAH
jgi:hypothetical protein